MKKLITLLTAFTLSAASSVMAVSCLQKETPPPSSQAQSFADSIVSTFIELPTVAFPALPNSISTNQQLTKEALLFGLYNSSDNRGLQQKALDEDISITWQSNVNIAGIRGENTKLIGTITSARDESSVDIDFTASLPQGATFIDSQLAASVQSKINVTDLDITTELDNPYLTDAQTQLVVKEALFKENPNLNLLEKATISFAPNQSGTELTATATPANINIYAGDETQTFPISIVANVTYDIVKIIADKVTNLQVNLQESQYVDATFADKLADIRDQFQRNNNLTTKDMSLIKINTGDTPVTTLDLSKSVNIDWTINGVAQTRLISVGVQPLSTSVTTLTNGNFGRGSNFELTATFNNALWVGSTSANGTGLHYLDNNTTSFKLLTSSTILTTSSTIIGMTADNDNGVNILWLAVKTDNYYYVLSVTPNGASYTVDQKFFSADRKRSETRVDFLILAPLLHKVYVSNYIQGVYVFTNNSDTGTLIPAPSKWLPGSAINNIQQIQLNRIDYIVVTATSGSGLFMLNTSDDQVQRIEPASGSSDNIQAFNKSLIVDPLNQSMYFVGLENKMYRINNFESSPQYEVLNDDVSLPAAFRILHIDSQSNLWIGTATGLYFLQNGFTPTSQVKELLPNNIDVEKIISDPISNYVFTISGNNRLAIYNASDESEVSLSNLRIPDDLSVAQVFILNSTSSAPSQPQILISTTEGKLYRWNEKWKGFIPFQGWTDSNPVITFYKDSQINQYFAFTNSGSYRLNNLSY